MSEIGKVTIDFQVDGRDYRWNTDQGLVRRVERKYVRIPGTDTKEWREVEALLLLPALIGTAVGLGVAVKGLEAVSAATTKPQPTKSAKKRRPTKRS